MLSHCPSVKMSCDAATDSKAAGRADGVTATATVNYWLGLKAALQPQPITPEAVAREMACASAAD